MDRELRNVLGSFIGGAVLISFGAYWLASASCDAKATAMETEHSFGILQGCIVKFQGRWIPLENIGVRDISN